MKTLNDRLRMALPLGFAVCAAVWIWREFPDFSSDGGAGLRGDTRPKAERASSRTGDLGAPASQGRMPTGKGLDEWDAAARKHNLQLTHFLNHRLNHAIAELMGLSREQSEYLNSELEAFLHELQEAEIERAFIGISPNGDERIVVPAASNQRTLDNLTTRIAHRLGPDAAEFTRRQIPLDTYLLEGKPFSIFYETSPEGSDTAKALIGTPIIFKNGSAKASEAWGGFFKLHPFVMFETAIGEEYAARFARLWSAAPNLERRAVPD